jgi:trypsin
MVEFEKCVNRIRHIVKVPKNVVCAGFPEPGKDSSQGDSGGPLVVDNRLVGLVGFNVWGPAKNYPGVYTDVASYLGWIKKYVKF